MELTFTLMDLGLFLIFFFGIAACIYIIILVRNLNKSATHLNDILDKNKENIDKTLNDMPVISKNVAELSETAKEDFNAFQSKIRKIAGAGQIMAPEETSGSDFFGKIKGIIEIVDVLVKLFTSGKKDRKESKAKNMKSNKDIKDMKDAKENNDKKESKIKEEPLKPAGE